jgi:hypothetical protein
MKKGLKGAQPATLPVRQPTRFQAEHHSRLSINVTTAKALGLPIPRSLLLRRTMSSNERHSAFRDATQRRTTRSSRPEARVARLPAVERRR